MINWHSCLFLELLDDLGQNITFLDLHEQFCVYYGVLDVDTQLSIVCLAEARPSALLWCQRTQSLACEPAFLVDVSDFGLICVQILFVSALL